MPIVYRGRKGWGWHSCLHEGKGQGYTVYLVSLLVCLSRPVFGKTWPLGCVFGSSVVFDPILTGVSAGGCFSVLVWCPLDPGSGTSNQRSLACGADLTSRRWVPSSEVSRGNSFLCWPGIESPAVMAKIIGGLGGFCTACLRELLPHARSCRAAG